MFAVDDAKIDELIYKWNVPGAAIAAVQGGKILSERGYGFVDTRHSKPVDAKHNIFRIASVSKPITAAAVLNLVHEGKLSLNSKVFDILSEYTPRDAAARDITVGELLDMTAGWNKAKSGDPILEPLMSRAARKMNVTRPPDFDATIRYVLRRKLDFKPGTKFAYSNFEYGLLGKIVEKITGRPYANFVRESVFAPAGVSLFEARTREVDRLADEVAYYAPTEKDRRSFFKGDPRKVPAPYARAYLEQDLPMLGWAATAPQLALLLDYILRDASTRETICATGKSRFSMGWEVKHTPSGACEFFRDGTLPGTRAFVGRTADGVTWVALFNARPTQKIPDPFAREFRQIMSSAFSSQAPTTKTSQSQTHP
jgi:N-acyl-D-amino-acid deacylase